MGRPTSYNPEIAEAICAAVASQPYGLEVVCADNIGFPSPRTIDRWQIEYPEFCLALTRAREARCDLLLDQGLEIADNGNEDFRLELRAGEYKVVVDQEAIARSRLRVETRHKTAAMLAPKKYGNRLALEHSGSISFNDMADEDIVERMRELIASGRVSLPDGYELVEIEDDPEPPEDNSDLA